MTLFEIIDDRGQPMMSTKQDSCIPSYEQLSILAKDRHKFRMDGKAVSLKKMKEYLDGIKTEE